MAEIYGYDGKHNTALVKQGDKYVMEFEAVPAFIFVSYDGNGATDQSFEHGVFMDDIKEVDVRSALDELTEFTTTKLATIKSTN